MGQSYRTITDETRALAVAHLKKLLPHSSSVAEAVRLVAEQFGVSDNSVRNWMRRAGFDPHEHLTDRRLADANATIAALTEMNRELTAHLTGRVDD